MIVHMLSHVNRAATQHARLWLLFATFTFCSFVQFMYDGSRIGVPMRQWTANTLGIWHPYQKACQVVWRRWAKRYFGPLFNALIPGANFFLKTKLRVIVTFFTYCRLAYPRFRGKLREAMHLAEGDIEHPNVKVALLDLHQLMEFFIPVVHAYT